ncbi:MAG TPA: septal ring lytic transglycosylase RlpA family protein [Stellaceae bacterium]|nr:septal ring lytic transglycosylase RlpA family protein [Stellaceae bacterium]
MLQPGPATAAVHHPRHLQAAKTAAQPPRQIGQASWYGDWHKGKATANGESFDPEGLTAAHPTLPMNTEVSVRNLANGKTVTVRINDRLPRHSPRIIDLTQRAAEQLGIEERGHCRVVVEALYIPQK